MKLITVLMTCILSLAGCGVLAPQKAELLNSRILKSDAEFVTLPANLRTIDIRENEGRPKYIVCSEPMPDIAMSNVLKLALEATQNATGKTSLITGADSASAEAAHGIGVKGSGDAAATALELAGRTQVVLLAREFLYRNCVARANGWLDNEDFSQSQLKIITQISDMISLEKEQAKASAAKAEAQAGAIKLVLDKRATADVAGAIKSEKNKFCMGEYDECRANAKDNKGVFACRESLMNCNQ